jgi:hypothetical protein
LCTFKLLNRNENKLCFVVVAFTVAVEKPLSKTFWYPSVASKIIKSLKNKKNIILGEDGVRAKRRLRIVVYFDDLKIDEIFCLIHRLLTTTKKLNE